MQQAPAPSSAPTSTGPSAHLKQISGQQTYAPVNYDEKERLKQRMSELRKHHNESANKYELTQPMIDNQIHEDTVKFLKNNQINGTKTKSQKPRAPKRAKPSATITGSQQVNFELQSSRGNTHNQQLYQQQNIPHQLQQPHQQHQPHQHQPHQHHQPHPHHQSEQIQHHPHQQHLIRQNLTCSIPQQYQNNIQSQQPTRMQPPTVQTVDQHGHVVNQRYSHYSQNYYDHQSHSNKPMNIYSTSSLPNDLDFNLQAGLECDVDYLIKHEMSVEGQLDFNHDLLSKLDNYTQPLNHSQH